MPLPMSWWTVVHMLCGQLSFMALVLFHETFYLPAEIQLSFMERLAHSSVVDALPSDKQRSGLLKASVTSLSQQRENLESRPLN